MDKEINYRSAGVDIDAGEAAVERIKKLAYSTYRPGVLHGLGGFGGLFAPDLQDLKDPVLVAGCDGVGTKLKLAFASAKHDTVGIDCVAMCVNDILAQGAEPLFFLDYLAVGKLLPSQVEEIISGVAEGCRQAGCALLGGEMAEMPGFYPPGEYDLAGFAVGIVSRSAIVDGSGIEAGDAIIGLASNGMHSNGYSLARKVLLEEAGLLLADIQPAFGLTLLEELLKPTRIYVREVLEVLKKYPIRGMAHITGGGLPGNLARILPEGLQAVIDTESWSVPRVFELIAELGPVSRKEMFRTFNMGIGYCLVARKADTAAVIDQLNLSGLPAYEIGRVEKGSGMVVIKDL